jgi:hypothetical protein
MRHILVGRPSYRRGRSIASAAPPPAGEDYIEFELLQKIGKTAAELEHAASLS